MALVKFERKRKEKRKQKEQKNFNFTRLPEEARIPKRRN